MAVNALFPLPLQNRPADIIARGADKPPQAGFDRRSVRVDFVAVQRQAGLQAQHIPRPQAAGQGAGGQQCLKDGRPGGGGRQQLKAILAGVAGAPDKDRTRAIPGGQQTLGPGKGADSRGRRIIGQGAKAIQQSRRLRPLQGNQGGFRSAILQSHAAGKLGGQPLAKPIQHRRAVAGVGNQQKAVGGQAVKDGVVDDAAPFVANQAVAGAAGPQGTGRAGQHPIQKGGGLRAGDIKPSHVGNIKEAGGRPHRLDFVDNAGILHRHSPTAKGHQPRPQIPMGLIKASLQIVHRAIIRHGTGYAKPELPRFALDHFRWQFYNGGRWL